MSWARLVPSWAWWALALALVAGVQQVRVWSADNRAATAIAAEAGYRAEISERDRRAALYVIQENQRRQAEVEKADAEAKQQLAAARGDAERAGSALERLQLRLAASEQRSRDAGNAITAQLGQTAESEARMRADVLARLGEAARLYADEADRRGIAGMACQAAYDKIAGK